MNINLNIVFKIVLMLLAVAFMKLKQLLSIYLTVSSTRTKEWSCWTKSGISTLVYNSKMIPITKDLLVEADHQIFKKLPSTNFTWSILEYFVPYFPLTILGIFLFWLQQLATLPLRKSLMPLFLLNSSNMLGLYGITYLHESNTEVYLTTCQPSMMERFCKNS